MWAWTRRFVALVHLAAGVILALAPSPGRWLWMSLAMWCLGSGIRWLAFDSRLADGRNILGFSMALGWKLMCAAYIAAGLCALVGLFLSTSLVFAAIVTPFIITWVLMWFEALRHAVRTGFQVGA